MSDNASTPIKPPALSLDALNAATPEAFVRLLDGIYEHSPWVAQVALKQRPLQSLAQLKLALVQAVREAGHAAQLQLIRAHPELAGRAMVAGSLTQESTGEQSRAGLTHCSAQEFATLQQLNRDYGAKFGFPFILAVRGARGLGLSRQEIIATFARRLQHTAAHEFAENLRNIHRIAELRLNDKFGFTPTLGERVWDLAQALAQHSDAPDNEDTNEDANKDTNTPRPLTVAYLTAAHQACAAQLQDWMQQAGFDEVRRDAVGNVVGLYRAAATVPAPVKRLLTGSHYDTVRNAGRYDGRLGVLAPIVCVQHLHAQGRRLPFDLEVVGFAEEEGQRFPVTFLGSSALTGSFQTEWLEACDAEGLSLAHVMREAGLPATLAAIAALRRDPQHYLGFVEIHIEQGPVLCEADLPLGVVSSINGSLRYRGEIVGLASHAGTTPMTQRRDALVALAEFALAIERRAAQDGDSVATIGIAEVPSGSINVVPGRCRFSLDLRAPNDAQRDRLGADAHALLTEICARRGVSFSLLELLRAAAAPSHPTWQARWAKAVQSLGLPAFSLPSGAGHDAMKLHEVMPQAMLFVRGANGGISHNPLESSSSDDMQLACDAFLHLLEQVANA